MKVTDKQSCYTVPKEKASNFLDKATYLLGSPVAFESFSASFMPERS